MSVPSTQTKSRQVKWHKCKFLLRGCKIYQNHERNAKMRSKGQVIQEKSAKICKDDNMEVKNKARIWHFWLFSITFIMLMLVQDLSKAGGQTSPKHTIAPANCKTAKAVLQRCMWGPHFNNQWALNSRNSLLGGVTPELLTFLLLTIWWDLQVLFSSPKEDNNNYWTIVTTSKWFRSP